MSVDQHPVFLLLEHDRAKPMREAPHRAEDSRILLDAMLAAGISDEAEAKSEAGLSLLLGIPVARVRSALAVGEQRGLFARRSRTVNPGTGETDVVWQLSPLFRDLDRKFAAFAEASSLLCREVADTSSTQSTADSSTNADFNLRIAKTIFGKWSVDILALIYEKRSARFQEIHQALGRISDRVLSLKLGQMEQLGLLRREVLGTRPPRVRYSLTSKGLRTVKLGEPVFLYLRLTEGLLATEPGGDSGRVPSP